MNRRSMIMMLSASARGLAYSGLFDHFPILTATNKGNGIIGVIPGKGRFPV